MRVRVGARTAQPGADVVPVEPGAVRGVPGERGGRVALGGHLLRASQDRGPVAAEGAAPGELGQHGGVQQVDVPGLGALPEELAGPVRGGPPQASLHPVPEVVEGGAGDRREGGDAARDAPDGHELPALHGAPVVADQVDRPAGADRVRDREEVVRQPVQGEAAAQRARGGGAAVAADVVQHHVEAVPLGEVDGHLGPHLLAVRVPVHEDHRRPVRIAQFGDAQVDLATAHPALPRTRHRHACLLVGQCDPVPAAASTTRRHVVTRGNTRSRQEDGTQGGARGDPGWCPPKVP
ncbi:hypothetical protein B0E37_03749 [Streptomyces sp. MH192]|nr:hypothetical protein [Streptomyces sp. MH192]MCF0100838.1 hypothetical protein [Streptomyces sp. MH191]